MPSVPSVAVELPELLCAGLFSGAGIEHVRAHRITAPFAVAEHTHADVLQLDWIVACRGGGLVAGEKIAIEPTTLVVIGPQVRHAMSLEALSAEARVYHVRIELPAPLIRQTKHLSIVRTRLSTHRGLESALADVWRLSVGGQGQSLLARAKLAEALALLPLREAPLAGEAKSFKPAGIDRDLEPALNLMELRLHSPPTLDELARSPFSRHFRPIRPRLLRSKTPPTRPADARPRTVQRRRSRRSALV
jgi:hypothetical protein